MKEQSHHQKQNIDENHQCSICLDVFFKPVQIVVCKHLFCSNCLNEAAIINNNHRCPLCRRHFGNNDLKQEVQFWDSLKKKYPVSVGLKQKLIQERVMVKLLIGNNTQQIATQQDNRYRWTLFIRQAEGGEQLHRMIESVDIQLHPTFRPRVTKIKVHDNSPILLQRIGWGTFRINVKVYWKSKFNQRYTDFYHDLQFEPVSQRTAQTFLTLKK